MTELDPIRWTESSDDAPELLRAPFAAGTREGPSSAQMRMLSLKLAAVAAGTAVAAGASTAQASATAGSTLAGGAAAGTALPLAKIVAAVVMVGATALGGVAFFNRPSEVSNRAPIAQSAGRAVDVPTPTIDAPIAVPSATGPSQNAVVNAPGDNDPEPLEIDAQEPSASRATSAASKPLSVKRSKRMAATKHKAVRASTKSSAVAAVQEAHQAERTEVDSKVDVPSEVELLRKARTALAARPREAFTLTEQHREHYPRGVFAQERDAIAIEALLRTGDTDAARSLAKSFVSAHPSSPHAHRFRETLGLQ